MINFGFDAHLGDTAKLGYKFGRSMEETRGWTNTVAISTLSDQLGLKEKFKIICEFVAIK